MFIYYCHSYREQYGYIIYTEVNTCYFQTLIHIVHKI